MFNNCFFSFLSLSESKRLLDKACVNAIHDVVHFGALLLLLDGWFLSSFRGSLNIDVFQLGHGINFVSERVGSHVLRTWHGWTSF